MQVTQGDGRVTSVHSTTVTNDGVAAVVIDESAPDRETYINMLQTGEWTVSNYTRNIFLACSPRIRAAKN
jgi:hypothetical protein